MAVPGSGWSLQAGPGLPWQRLPCHVKSLTLPWPDSSAGSWPWLTWQGLGPERSRLVHVCSGWASQGEIALALPGPDLKGPRIQANPVGLALLAGLALTDF